MFQPQLQCKLKGKEGGLVANHCFCDGCLICILYISRDLNVEMKVIAAGGFGLYGQGGILLTIRDAENVIERLCNGVQADISGILVFIRVLSNVVKFERKFFRVFIVIYKFF